MKIAINSHFFISGIQVHAKQNWQRTSFELQQSGGCGES